MKKVYVKLNLLQLLGLFALQISCFPAFLFPHRSALRIVALDAKSVKIVPENIKSERLDSFLAATSGKILCIITHRNIIKSNASFTELLSRRSFSHRLYAFLETISNL